MEVCNTETKNELRYGDTLNKQYFASLTAQDYVPGTTFTADAQDWVTDSLVVSAYKTVAIYVDDVQDIQANINQRTQMQEEIAYQLRDAIDTHALLRMKEGEQKTAGQMVAGGTAGHSVSASTANIIDMFSKARTELRKNNVSEAGDWIAILHPSVAQLLEYKSTSVGYNTADATLRNGYAGTFMGFKIYVSNNVPTGTSPSGLTNHTAQIDANYEVAYFGKAKAIDLVVQKAPSVQITKVPDMHGYYVAAYAVYGDAVFTKNASRFLTVTTVGLN